MREEGAQTWKIWLATETLKRFLVYDLDSMLESEALGYLKTTAAANADVV